MSELQSNAAFRLSKNPRYHYCPPIALPPYLMYDMETLTFWCAIMLNDDLVPFQMSAHPDTGVNDFKKAIKEEMALRDVAAPTLVLWKVIIILHFQL